jgi:uncharacterized UPF0146 family protein
MPHPSDRNHWLSENAALELLGFSRGAGRDLLSQGLLRPAQDGIFRDADIAEGTILQHIRPLLGRISTASNTWAALREEGAVAVLVDRALSLEATSRFEVVVDEVTRDVVGVVNDGQLLMAVRAAQSHSMVVVDLTQELKASLTGFRRIADRGPVPAKRRGRPRKSAEIHRLPIPATAVDSG